MNDRHVRHSDFSGRLFTQVAVVGLHLTHNQTALKQTIISVTGHLECSSIDPASAELDAVAVAAPVPLLIAQVRVVENEGESSNK